MILLDANLLIYAHIPAFPQHGRASSWLESTLSEGKESIGIIWQVVNTFLRISTNSRIFDEPITVALAKGYIDNLFSHPLVRQITPTEEHWDIYSKLLIELNITGDMVMDAHIAAMAVGHKATVASADKDFRRFSDYVKIIDPFKTK